MASTVWKGYISFGLISIPVRLYAAARDERVGFNQIHLVCNSRIKQQLYCPTCERVVERSEIGKGYEQSKNHYTIIEDEELKKIAPASSDTMDIQQFVKLEEIDPIYFDTSYYIVPEDPGRKAYQLLLKAMKNENFVALAQVSMHQREYTVAVRPYEKGLTLHTMYYANEVRKLNEYEDQGNVELKTQEVEMAEKLIHALARPFNPEAYHDEYQKKVLELIEAKSEGKTVQGAPHKRMAPVIDLMKALENSLAGVQSSPAESGKKAPQRVAKARPAKAASHHRRAS
jgi:DNA end-binding protein Ku